MSLKFLKKADFSALPDHIYRPKAKKSDLPIQISDESSHTTETLHFVFPSGQEKVSPYI